jgi:phage FluMu gp28-like protein
LAERPRRIAETAANRDYDDWQSHLMDNASQTILLNKARRVGGTKTCVEKLTIKGLLRARYGHSAQGISIRQKDSEGLIDYARELLDDLPPRFKLPVKGSDSKTEIAVEHPGTGRRWKFTAYPNTAPRSRGGDVLLDEFAHGRDDRKIFKGALPCLSLSPADQLIVLSTPFAKTGVFYDLVRRPNNQYSDWFHYLIPWWLCPRLCIDTERARTEAPLMSTRERVMAFGTLVLRAILDSFPDLESFQVEYELAFLDAVSALFPPELLNQICVADWGDGPGCELASRIIEGPPSELDWMWLQANKTGILYGGFDVGRKRNESDFLIWDIDGQKKILRMIIRLAKTDYKTQGDVLKAGCSKGHVLRTCIDATGIGNELAENLAKEYPGRFEGIWFTQAIKDQLATRLYIACTAAEREIWMPRDRSLMLHFISIRKEAGSSGQVRYSVELNDQLEAQQHHADMFWAAALGLQAANLKVIQGGFYVLPNVRPRG